MQKHTAPQRICHDPSSDVDSSQRAQSRCGWTESVLKGRTWLWPHKTASAKVGLVIMFWKRLT